MSGAHPGRGHGWARALGCPYGSPRGHGPRRARASAQAWGMGMGMGMGQRGRGGARNAWGT